MTEQLFQIETNLTQHYRLANPVRGSNIAPHWTTDGVLHVFSVGSDNHIYDIYQDATSDTGWSKADMAWPGGSAKVVALAAGFEINGTTTVFVGDANGVLYFICYEPRSGTWQKFFTAPSSYTLVSLKLCNDNNTGALLCTAFLQSQTTPSLLWIDYTQNNNNQGIGIGNVADPSPSDYMYVNPLVDYAVGPDASAGSPNGLSIYTVGACSKIKDGTTYTPAAKKTPWENGTDAYWAWDVSFSQVALAANPSKPSESVIFALESANNFAYLFDPTAQQLINLSGKVQLSDVRPFFDVQGTLGVVGIGTDHQLYHARQLAADKLDAWSDMVSLNDKRNFRTVRTAWDADGNIILFAIDTAYDLWQISRDPTTQDWHFVQIEVGNGALEQLNAYITRVSVEDEFGAPQANVEVEITASGPVPATINGTITTTLFPDLATTHRADAFGRLVIAVDADGLSTPTVLLRTSSMPAGDQVAVEPNGDIQTKLRNLSGQDLLQPKNFNGEPITLLTGDFNSQAVADAVAQACNQSMAMAGAGASFTDAVARRHLAARTKAQGIRHVAAKAPITAGRIDLAAVPDRHWELDFSSPGGLPVFRQLTRSSAAALMAERRASSRSLSDWDFDVDWGDIWNEVTDTVGEVVSVVVSAVVDTATQVVTEIQAQITLIVDGIKAVYDATIDFVEQVFDMVSGIFQKVLIGLEQLYEWLCYIFKWDDIVRTAKVVKHMLNASLEFMSGAATRIQTEVDDQFNQLTTVVQTRMDEFIASFAGDETIGALLHPPVPPEQAADSRAAENPLLDAMLQNAPRLAAAKPGARKLADNPIFNQILDALSEFYNDLEHGKARQAFEEAVKYFQAIKDSPEQIFSLAAKGFLKIIEGIGLGALEAAGGLLSAFFKIMSKVILLVEGWLNEEWTIPIVSDIYEYATGEKAPSFTLVDICAMIIATPTTAFYKVMKDGAVPFSEADVEWVETAITAKWIDQRIWGRAPGAAPAAAADDGIPANVLYVCNIGFAYNALLRIAPEIVINGEPTPPPSALGWLNIVQRFAASGLSLPSVLNAPAGPLKTFGAAIWCSQLLFGPVRGVFLLAAAADGMDLPAEIGDRTLCAWGAIRTLLEAAFAITEGAIDGANYDWRKSAEGLLNGAGPQFGRILHLQKVQAETELLSLPAGAFVAALSLAAIGALRIWRTVDPKPIAKPEPALALSAPRLAVA